MRVITEERTDEVRQLRSCLNDLLSLLALPAMWQGRESSQIIETLLDTLLGMLRVDFAYARLKDPASDSRIEVTRIAQAHTTQQSDAVAHALEPWLDTDASVLPLVMQDPLGEGDVQIKRFPLGLKEEAGLVIVGSKRSTFPTETETLLLRVATNQAAIAIDKARLFELAERERTEAQAAREQVANILESITDSFSVYDKDWRVTYLNREAEKLLPRLGLTRKQVLGKNIWEVLPDLVGSDIYQKYHRAVAEQVPVEFEIFFPLLDGWYEVRAYPAKDYLAVYSQDITSRKNAEQGLRQSEQRYRQLIHALPAAIYACDVEGRVSLYNEAAAALWGREPEIGKDFWYGSWNIYKPDGSPLPLDQCPMTLAIKEGRPILGQEIVVERPDGTRRWVLPYPDPIRDPSGAVVGAVNMLVDLTERKQLEQEREQLLAREQFARTEAERRWKESQLLAEATRQFSTSLQLQDLLPAICRAARAITDADAATVVLREDDKVHYVEEDSIEPLWKGHRFPISACISGWSILEHKPAIVEDIYDDPRLPIEAYQATFVKSLVMVPVRSQDPLGAIGVYWAEKRKATKREVELLEALADSAHIALINTQLYEQTKAAREQAEEASRLKDEFLATISHELRTPLNAMLGWSRMLRSGKLDERTNQRAVETIERNAIAQAQLIEDLLDVSRIISGKMRLDVQPVDLAPTIQAAVESVRLAADAKGIHLNVVLDPRAGPVSGDPTRLQQIVWNLLSNAIKFTPKDGRVQVRLERVNSHLEIRVADTGIGISPDFLPNVFDRFRQADGTTTRKHGGLGLGLAIVRHLVELHGGNIFALSEGEGRGATFTIRFPLMSVSEIEAFPAERSGRKHPNAWSEVAFECPAALRGLRVLIVEDEQDGRQLMATILGRCDAEVLTVGSAAEALHVLERIQLDVLISDIEMPGEDGYSLIRKLRAKENSMNGRIPAAALTAHAAVADRMRALSAGFDIHLPKPVEPAELVAVIASLASRVTQRSRS